MQSLDSIIEHYLAISSEAKEWVKDPETGERNFAETGKRIIQDYDVAHTFSIRAINAIWEICPKNSIYYQEATNLYHDLEFHCYDYRLYNLICNIRNDLELGFIGKISSLIHQQIFSDYLNMAQHLLNEGYKDASAVIAGSTLESHLRRLCIANQIDTEVERKDGKKQPMKASSMNTELKKKDVYSLYDQKMVTAQLDLRNNAAHGKYDLYTNEQVEHFLVWLEDFIDRNPT